MLSLIVPTQRSARNFLLLIETLPPQVAETNTPQSMDVTGVYSLYDEFMVCSCLDYRGQGKLIMNIEKTNTKVFNIIIMVMLAAILVTIAGGLMMQRQTMPLRDNGMGMGRGTTLFMDPESAQTGPTGRLVMSTGVVLLFIGLGVLVVILWAGRSSPRGNSS